MRDWFLYSDNGEHVGPVTPELLARGLESGKVSRDARVARDRMTWQPVLTVPEVVEALEILRTADGASFPNVNEGGPEAPSTQPDMNDLDMTDVMVRDDELRTAIAKAKRAVSANPKTTSSVPPKPPLPARASNPALPAHSSVPPSQPKVPSAPRVPSSPAIPAQATLVAGSPGAAPALNVPPSATMIHSPAPAAPFYTPPMQPTVSPQQQQPSQPPLPPHRPPMPSQPPQHFAPPMPGAPAPVQLPPAQAAPAAPTPPAPAAAPAAPAAKEDKLDPRFHILIPLGVFGVFVVLSIFMTIIALITKPWLTPEEKNAPPAATTAPARK